MLYIMTCQSSIWHAVKVDYLRSLSVLCRFILLVIKMIEITSRTEIFRRQCSTRRLCGALLYACNVCYIN